MHFITVNLLKSILPWTALNISILFNLHLQMSNLRKTRKLQILLVDFYNRIVMPLQQKKKKRWGPPLNITELESRVSSNVL